MAGPMAALMAEKTDSLSVCAMDVLLDSLKADLRVVGRALQTVGSMVAIVAVLLVE